MNYTITNLAGNVVARGKNLRCVLDHGRKVPGIHTLYQNGYDLRVVYANGDETTTVFADRTVLADWIKGRVKHGRGRWIGNL